MINYRTILILISFGFFLSLNTVSGQKIMTQHINDHLQSISSSQQSNSIDFPVDALSKKYDKVFLRPETEQRLSKGDKAFVIVEYKTNEKIPLTMSREKLPLLAKMIGESKTSFMAQLKSKTKVDIRREMKYSAQISMIADRSNLEKLMSMADVLSIKEDRLSKPLLNNSFVIVGADKAHDMGASGQGCTIAVLDTGIDLNHDLFNDGRVKAGTCFNSSFDLTDFGLDGYAESNCPNGLDQQISYEDGTAGTSCDTKITSCFHGNHVAGIAAGGSIDLSFIPTPLQGIASGSDLVGMNVFTTFYSQVFCGGPNPCLGSFSSDQLSAFEWVADNYLEYNICAVNMSLGSGQSFINCDSDPLYPIITLLRELGVATIISSGNDGFDDSTIFPACISTAISVGSVTSYDEISGFSNHGPNDLVDLLAPGEAILSAYGIENGEMFYAYAWGTSMAAPHVAGAFSILKAAFPNASVDDIEAALKSTGKIVTDDARGISGSRIQIDAALDALTPPENIPTMGQWGLMILGLLILICSTVAIRERHDALKMS